MQPNNPYQAPVAAPVMSPGGGGAGGSYEFNEFQNLAIKKTAERTRMWGIVSLVAGGLGLVLTIFLVVSFTALDLGANLGGQTATVSALVFGFLGPMSLVYAVVGYLYIESGNSLLGVVTTQGDDVTHLMQALDKMAKAFRLEVIMTAIGFVVGLVLGIVNASAGGLS